jgi:hypothetical protein
MFGLALWRVGLVLALAGSVLLVCAVALHSGSTGVLSLWVMLGGFALTWVGDLIHNIFDRR